MTDCCQEAVAPHALLGFLEGRAGGVAASGSEGVSGLGGVAEVPVLSELGCLSLLTSQQGFCRKEGCGVFLPCQVSHGTES